MSVYWTSNRVLLREAAIECRIKNLSPLRVGSGREPPLGSTVDLAVVKMRIDGALRPYIPGSSLKGVFRSTSESLLRLKKPRVEPCSGLSKSTCMDVREVETAEGAIRLGRYVDQAVRSGNTESAMRVFFEKTCLMCKVFGAPSYSGKTYFSDAYPVGDYHLGVRAGIAINRRTGAVMQGALYTVEYVEPGVRFSFSIHCRNLPNYVLGLLASVIFMLRSGEVRLGGFKTRGFGLVTVEDISVRVRDYPSSGRALRPLEEGVDEEVNLGDLVTVRDGWLESSGEKAWKVLSRLREVWDHASL